jgi:hypothetical protein
LQRKRRKASHSATPAAPRRVQWAGDAHDPKAVVLKLNGNKLEKVQAQYRRLRLTQIEGMTMEQAIGLHVPSTKGTATYSRADLKYDMQTGLIELVPLQRETLDEEHVERQPPTEEQMIGPPSKTEMKSVGKGHEHVCDAYA